MNGMGLHQNIWKDISLMVMNDEWLVFEQCEFNTTWKEIGLTMMNDEWFVLFFFVWN